MPKTILFLLLSFLFFLSKPPSTLLQANNLQLSNLQLEGEATLTCEISWNNSWNWETSTRPENYPENHDAVWLFGKYKVGGSIWMPLHFSSRESDYQSSHLFLEFETVEDQLGVFVRSGFEGATAIETSILKLKLESSLPLDRQVQIQVLGIEMVYIPEGPFWLGDGESENSFVGKDSLFQIQSEAAIPNEGQNRLTSLNLNTNPYQHISTFYPKGFASFYCMKHEISQEQYATFLNSLTYTQQRIRTHTQPNKPIGTPAFFLQNRNGLIIAESGFADLVPALYACDGNGNGKLNETNDGQNRACNFLSGGDVRAYLDWAGLRPMTELEYEKACRGPLSPISKEFVWGSTTVSNPGILEADGTAQEMVLDSIVEGSGLAHYNYSEIQGPLRCGFAAQGATDRLTAGATYYGVMEMSGNVWEYCINVDSVGVLFEGSHGDGLLDENGDSDSLDWPFDDQKGTTLRGGGWNSGDFQGFRDAAISARFYAILPTDQRRNTTGGRGVRSGF